MMSLPEEKQSEVIETFSSTSRDWDLFNIDKNYFDGMISKISSRASIK